MVIGQLFAICIVFSVVNHQWDIWYATGVAALLFALMPRNRCVGCAVQRMSRRWR